ncbi:hypothetical protein ACHAXR_001946 [Thalassiosira sp. AJA248-18]
MTISNVVIAIAMKAEASPFVNHINLQHDTSFFPSEAPSNAFRGKHNNGTGVENVGTVPATVATFLTLQKMNVADEDPAHLLINAGTCGGFQRKGAAIGDVFLTTAVANHDRRIAIPDFTPYGTGRIESTSVENLAIHLDAKLGVCTTGNSLDFHELDTHHMLENDASVKDMEAAAIAWAAEIWSTPYFGEKPSHEEFMENLVTAAQSLQSVLPKLMIMFARRSMMSCRRT